MRRTMMGWASYVEDMVERLDADRWQPLDRRLDDVASQCPHLRQQLASFRSDASRTLTEVRRALLEATSMLELATSPEVDLACENQCLERTVGALAERLAVSKQQAADQHTELRKLRLQVQAARAELRTAQHELTSTRRQLAEAQKAAAELAGARALRGRAGESARRLAEDLGGLQRTIGAPTATPGMASRLAAGLQGDAERLAQQLGARTYGTAGKSGRRRPTR
ncbi:MAG: hypothetical protein HYU66_17975 [Armatimonadetes bacterium]|nr:hypothetical protein [Armatimonadota bacterium]